jgi:hypothetical protein
VSLCEREGVLTAHVFVGDLLVSSPLCCVLEVLI